MRDARRFSMNKTIQTLVVVVALVSTQASADVIITREGEEDSPNVLLFNPGDLINGVISIEYERALNSFFGLALGVSVSTFRGAFTPANASSYTAVGPEIAARFHFIKDAPGGLWVGPSIQGVYIASRSQGTVTRAVGYGLGAAIGYNFILGRHFVFQLGVGGGFNDYGDGLAWAPRLKLGLGGTF
jgi:hypothetical protein